MVLSIASEAQTVAKPTSADPSTNSVRITPDLQRGASVLAIVALALFVSSCGDAEVTQASVHAQAPATSEPTTSAPVAPASTTTPPGEPDFQSDGGPVVETDLDATETSFGTLRWTRVTGDAASLPLGAIEATSDGELVVFERGFVWRSTDGLDWSRHVIDGLESVPDVYVMGSWAISWGVPFENQIYEAVEGLWQELDLPAPQLPDVPGLVWHSVSSRPLESGETTLIPWHAVSTVAWGDVDGLLDIECGERHPCTAVVFTNFLPNRGIWFVTTPENGRSMSEFTMQVTESTIVFTDATTGEEVHRIVAESPEQAEFIAEQMKLPYSSNIEGLFHTGAWVRRSGGRFELQQVPWTRPPRSIVALPSGGFAAYQNTQRDGYTPGDSRVWTSSDGLTWVDHGEPAFLTEDTQHFFVDIQGGELRAEVILDPGTTGGDPTVERYTSSDGLVWYTGDVPPEVPAFTQLFDADFGTVATGFSPQQELLLFWISVDGESWEEVAGPPGPHFPGPDLSERGGNSFAGGAQDFLWLMFGDYEGARTFWIGRFD